MPAITSEAAISQGFALGLAPESSLLSRIGQQGEVHDTGKIDKAAKDFESILLTQWLEQAREAFAVVPGGDEDDANDPGASQLQSIGMQSLATAITNSGGIGIATLIRHRLQDQQNEGVRELDKSESVVSGADVSGRWTAGSLHPEKSRKKD